MNVNDTLEEAASRVDAQDWTHGRFMKARLGDEAIAAVEKHLGVQDFVAWNDAPGRTKEDVVAALRGAKS